MSEDIPITRRNYNSPLLPENFGNVQPLERFKEWFTDAQTMGVLEPDAMNLATYDGKKVNSRTVALRGLSDTGLLIYTNYNSSKAKEMDAHDDVAVTFHWKENFRQVRMRAQAHRLTGEQSDQYFATRPHGSQVGAWVSRQSEPLGSRKELEEEYARFEGELGQEVSRPPFWGGYELVPYEYEFFQGHESRLHDRFLFTYNEIKKRFDAQRLWP